MTLYYRVDDPSDVRDLGEQIAAWEAAGNPKAEAWAAQPPQPSPDAVWQGGQWVTPTPNVPQAISARQIRLWLVRHGVSLAMVDAAIDGIQDAMTREAVRVEWEYAPHVERTHAWLVPMAAALGLTEAQVDAAFREAATL
jgi:hypothetical protein